MTFPRFHWNSKWPPQINFNFLGGEKHHIPSNMGMCKFFLKMLPNFKISTRGQLQIFLWAQKLEVRNYSNFTIIFPTIWRCAGDFFKVLLKFEMAAMDKLHICLWAQKTEKFKSVIIYIVQSHYPPSGNVHVILLKFKMATTNQLFKYLWSQKV